MMSSNWQGLWCHYAKSFEANDSDAISSLICYFLKLTNLSRVFGHYNNGLFIALSVKVKECIQTKRMTLMHDVKKLATNMMPSCQGLWSQWLWGIMSSLKVEAQTLGPTPSRSKFFTRSQFQFACKKWKSYKRINQKDEKGQLLENLQTGRCNSGHKMSIDFKLQWF